MIENRMTAPVAVSTVPEDQLQQALLSAVGFDKLSPAQRELALAIARAYGLDPMLRHLVIVEGKPYITRDGLLHVAHKSGVFDGIEVDQPELDADGKYWRTWATVYRKDMSRAFRYPGRYPATGGNARYNEEMCIKGAEVMTLRRAFDVAAPVIEERWDLEEPEAQPESVPLQDRIAAKAALLEERTDDTPAQESAAQTSETAPQAEGAPVAVTEASEPSVITTPTETPAPDGEEAPGPTLAEFGALIRDVDQGTIRTIARGLFPELRKFTDLTPAQLQQILDRLAADRMAEAREEAAAADESTEAAEAKPDDVRLCGAASPYGDGETCKMNTGHHGPHSDGAKVSW